MLQFNISVRVYGYDEFLKEYALGHQMEYSELKEIMDELQERTKEFQTLPEWLAHVEEYKHTLQMQRQQRGNGTGDGVTCLTMHGARVWNMKLFL